MLRPSGGAVNSCNNACAEREFCMSKKQITESMAESEPVDFRVNIGKYLEDEDGNRLTTRISYLEKRDRTSRGADVA
jgi:hypothetical protein